METNKAEDECLEQVIKLQIMGEGYRRNPWGRGGPVQMCTWVTCLPFDSF